MLTTFSLWGIYFASYLVDYVLILLILIVKQVNHTNGISICNGTDFLIDSILIVFIAISIIVTNRIGKIEMNTRVKIIPEKNITQETTTYFLAQVVTVATTIFTDWWIPIDVLVFIIMGMYFVKSKAVYTSPLFVIPLGNIVLRAGDDVIITNYSLQEIRMAQEDSLYGLEARELTNRVFYIRK